MLNRLFEWSYGVPRARGMRPRAPPRVARTAGICWTVSAGMADVKATSAGNGVANQDAANSVEDAARSTSRRKNGMETRKKRVQGSIKRR